MAKTKIEWTEHSWNPVTGCTPVSEGCSNCYARVMARRLAGRCGYPEVPHHFDVTLHPDRLDIPLRRKKPTTYFVCSMSDLFHEDVPWEFINKVWTIAHVSHRHTFQILTKRPARMLEFFRGQHYSWAATTGSNIPPSNVWLGVSVENQATADERREYLRQCPAAVKFISYEPALSAIDWTGWEFVSQIISGGESGPGARPSHPDWHRATRDFCQENGIAYFFKQWGEWVCPLQLPDGAVQFPPHNSDRWHGETGTIRVGRKRAGRLLDGREHNELPNTPRTQP